jgi:hypothetical protein
MGQVRTSRFVDHIRHRDRPTTEMNLFVCGSHTITERSA